MRRAVLTLAAGGVLFAAAACGTSSNPGAGAGQATPLDPAVQASLADTRTVCEALAQVYGKNIGPFATAVSTMATGPTGSSGASRDQARQALTAMAKGIRDATRASTNPQVRADGAQTADQLRAKSADKAFLSGVHTSKDVDTLLGPTLKGWLAPVQQHCA